MLAQMWQGEAAYMQNGDWADQDHAACDCRGRGWKLSDWDAWYECPFHKGTPHPESDETWTEAQWAAHMLKVQRQTFSYLRGLTKLSPKGFVTCSKRKLPVPPGQATPEQWLAAARLVVGP